VNYSQCECDRQIRDLEYRLGCLETELRGLKRELERESDDRRSAVGSVRSDLADLYAEVTTCA